MARSEYDVLLDELKSLIRSKGALKASEIISWASNKNIGDVVLTLLVKDAVDEMDVETSGEVILDKDLNLTIPNEIRLKKIAKKKVAEPKREALTYLLVKEKREPYKRGRITRKRKKRRERKRGATITEFFRAVPEKPKGYKERKIVREESLAEEEIKKEETRLPPLSDDVIKAITYLSEYWSVGEIRFIEDLKRMGVENPREVIIELLKLGYIERKPIGVINATKKMPRIKPKSYLSDVL